VRGDPPVDLGAFQVTVRTPDFTLAFGAAGAEGAPTTIGVDADEAGPVPEEDVAATAKV